MIAINIESMEGGTYSGVAHVEFGPIRLSPAIKSTLVNLIQSGGTKFMVESISGYDVDESGATGSIVLMADGLKITKENGRKHEISHKILLTEDCPILLVQDRKTVILEFNQDYSNVDDLQKLITCEGYEINEGGGNFSKKKNTSKINNINPDNFENANCLRIIIRLISQSARD